MSARTEEPKTQKPGRLQNAANSATGLIRGIDWSVWEYSLNMFAVGAMWAAVLTTSAVLYAIEKQPVTSSVLGAMAAASAIIPPIMMHRSIKSLRERRKAARRSRASTRQ